MHAIHSVSRINFGRHGNSSQFLGDGWYQPEDEFTWCSGDISDVLLKVPGGVDNIRVELVLHPYLGKQSEKRARHVSIVIDGEVICTKDVSARDVISFSVPSQHLSTVQEIGLRLLHLGAERPLDGSPESTDDRFLSIAVHSMSIYLEIEAAAWSKFIGGGNGDGRILYDKFLLTLLTPVTQRSSEVIASYPDSDKKKLNVKFNKLSDLLGSISGSSIDAPFSIRLPFPVDLTPPILRFESKEGGGGFGHEDRFVVNGREFNLINFPQGSAIDWCEVGRSWWVDICLSRPLSSALSSGSLVMKLSYGDSCESLESASQDVLLELARDCLRNLRVGRAERILGVLWRYKSMRLKIIELAIRCAQISCDPALELIRMEWAFRQKLPIEIELCIRYLRLGLSIRAVDVACQYVDSARDPSRQLLYELGIAYRNLRWIDKAVASQGKVSDPHVHWGSVIRSIASEKAELKRRMRSRAKKVREYLAEKHMDMAVDTAILFAVDSIAIGRMAWARLVIKALDTLSSPNLDKLRALLVFRETSNAGAALLVLAGRNQRNEDSVVGIPYDAADYCAALGQHELAAHLYLDRPLPSGDGLNMLGLTQLTAAGQYSDAMRRCVDIYSQESALPTAVAHVVVSQAASSGIVQDFVRLESPMEYFPRGGAGKYQGMIIQYWNDPVVPEDVADCMKSWKDFYPRAQYLLHSESSAREFIFGELGDEGVQCFDYCHHPAMQSDFLRLVVLQKFGGVYLDADLVCKADLIGYVEHARPQDVASFVAFPLVPNYPFAANNDIIFANPGNRFIESLIESILSDVSRDRRLGIHSNVAEVSGPGLLCREIARSILSKSTVKGCSYSGIFAAIPFFVRSDFVGARNDLEYFRSRKHWSEI